MKTHFYAHIVHLENVHQELMALDLSPDERKHLLLLITSTIHHVVVDVIITELPDEHKKTFLAHLAQDNHSALWNLIKQHIKDPEIKIKHAAEALKQEFLADIQKANQRFS